LSAAVAAPGKGFEGGGDAWEKHPASHYGSLPAYGKLDFAFALKGRGF